MVFQSFQWVIVNDLSDELILAGKLQLNLHLQKLKPKKEFRLGRGLKPCLPDTDWALLPTEQQSHMLGARQNNLDVFRRVARQINLYFPQSQFTLFQHKSK